MVEIENLHKTYYNGTSLHVLKGINLSVPDGEFLSKDDLRTRSKLSKTVVDLMGDLGLLGDMPESNQLSLFDFV